MQLGKEGKETIDKLKLWSGVNSASIRQMYLMQAIMLVFDFGDKDTTYIPFLGEVKIKSDSDTESKKGREANVEITIIPSKSFKRAIGEAKDGDPKSINEELMKQIMTEFGKKADGV